MSRNRLSSIRNIYNHQKSQKSFNLQQKDKIQDKKFFRANYRVLGAFSAAFLLGLYLLYKEPSVKDTQMARQQIKNDEAIRMQEGLELLKKKYEGKQRNQVKQSIKKV